MSAGRTPTRFFLLDPTFAIVLAGLLIVAGVVSYTSMVRENYPDLAIPQATVTVEWPGASPGQMEKEVVKRLEDEIRSLTGLARFESSSRKSFALVTVKFAAERSIPEAMRELRVKVNAAAATFPKNVKDPVIEQVSVSDLPIMTVALSGDVDFLTLDRAAVRLSRALEELDGVRKTGRQGDRGEAVHVRLRPERLRSLGLSAVAVRDRVRDANHDMAWGALESEEGTWPLYLSGRYRDLDDIRGLTIQRTDALQTARLDTIADVFRGLKQYAGDTKISEAGEDYHRAITMSVRKRPGADTIATIDRVRAHLATLPDDPNWPLGVDVKVVSDEGEIIKASFNEVRSNLVQGVIAVFAVLLIALTWRAATVAALALPITLAGALAIVALFGFTLNTLVMLGMVIALGILVDVFILVMEGMHEGMSVRGETFEEAAVATAKTFFLPALAGQATTILAMAPLMMIGGIDGKFVRLVPFTAIACLVMSLIIAFAVCIPLSRYVLGRGGGHQAPTWMDRQTEKAAALLQGFLIRLPVRGRGAAGATVGAALALFVVSLLAASTLPSIIYPKEDRRSLGVTVQLRPDAAFVDAARVAEKIGAALLPREEFSNVFIHAGEVSPYATPTIEDYLLPTKGPALVGASIRFQPKSERDRPTYAYLPEIRAALEAALVDEAGAVVRLTPDLGGATAGDPIQIEIRGEDLLTLRDLATEVSDIVRRTPGATDVRDTLGAFPTEARFETNREALSFYEVAESDLLEEIRIAMVADKIGVFQMPGTERDLDILLGTQFPSRGGEVGGPREFFEIETLSIVTPKGDRTPFTSLVNVQLEPTPAAILHAHGRRVVTVFARVADGKTAGDLVTAFTPDLTAAAELWPAGYQLRILGEAASSKETFGNTQKALILALILVFAVMALLFGSFRQPFIIMAMVPLSLTGVFLGFAVLSIPISFPAMIGVIALIGIVVNDAIVMVEVINKRRAEGYSKREAAAHGASDRLRPILTTSITTVAGLTPLAFATPFWFPLCMAVILGLSIATVFALIVIPALYVLIEGTKDVVTPPARAESIPATPQTVKDL